MIRTSAILAFALVTSAFGQQESGQPFLLAPGDYRWVPFTIRQPPAEVDCSFEVIKGGGSVHVELMPSSEFRLFERGREHDAMTRTPDGHTGEFRQMIAEPGRYAIVLMNRADAPAVTVALHFATNMNPTGGMARTLSPTRQLTVILISMFVFFTVVTWSARRLIRAVRL